MEMLLNSLLLRVLALFISIPRPRCRPHFDFFFFPSTLSPRNCINKIWPFHWKRLVEWMTVYQYAWGDTVWAKTREHTTNGDSVFPPLLIDKGYFIQKNVYSWIQLKTSLKMLITLKNTFVGLGQKSLFSLHCVCVCVCVDEWRFTMQM